MRESFDRARLDYNNTAFKTTNGIDGISRSTGKPEVLNYEDDFVGLSETANKSKGSKSYSEWTMYKKEGLEVRLDFRKQMMLREQRLEIRLQRIIDELNKK